MIAIIWMIDFVLKVELSIQNFILILLMIGFNSFLTVSDVFLHLFEESICGLIYRFHDTLWMEIIICGMHPS